MTTRKFAVSIDTGKKKYAPGEDVPVGGKSGLTEEEANAIDAAHGTWAGQSSAPASGADKEAIAALEAEVKKQAATIKAADDLIAALGLLTDAYGHVEDAAIKASADEATDADRAALAEAEKALEDAKAEEAKLFSAYQTARA
tara:strand:+ start:23002 stop:23430 length:429 start_codon:yes stop_codon:yes gene_type:complete